MILRLAAATLTLLGLALPAHAADLDRSPWSPEASPLGATLKLDAFIDSQQIYNDQAVFAAPTQTAQPGAAAVSNPDALHQSTNLGLRDTRLAVSGRRALGGSWSAEGYGELGLLAYPGIGADPSTPAAVLRDAYVWLRPQDGMLSWAAGQLEGPFAPLDPVLLNSNPMHYGGNLGARLPQLRGRLELGPASLEAAVLKPADLTVDVRAAVLDLVGRGQDSAVPELQGRLAMALPLGDVPYGLRELPAELGVSGRFAQEAYGAGTGSETRINSWGAAVDARAALGPLWLAGEAHTGAALEHVYGLGGVAGNVSGGAVLPMAAVRENGGWATLGLQVLDGLEAHVSYGLAVPDSAAFAVSGKGQTSSLDVTRNQAIAFTTTYEVLPGTLLGLEALHLDTAFTPINQGGSRKDGSLDRLQISVIWTN